VASAHSALATLNDCSSVTFSYINFPATGNDTATQKITINGVTTTTVATWSNSRTHSDTVAFDGTGDNGKTLTPSEVMTSSADGFVGNGPRQTFTLSGCKVPLVYTGRAYDVGAVANLLGIVNLAQTYINDSTPLTSMGPFPEAKTVLMESIPALGLSGGQASQSVNLDETPSTSTASAAVNDLTVADVLGLNTGEVESTSTTVCNADGTLTETGTVTIASLTIDGMNLTIPSSAFLDANPNYVLLNIPGVVTVILNHQMPTADGAGLQVDAVYVHLLGLLGMGATVTISHSESDVENCS